MARVAQGALLSIIVLATIPGTAWAARWVQMPGDQWFWIDLDSIYTSNGITYYNFEHGPAVNTPPSANAATARDAIDCGSRQYFHYEEEGFFAHEERSGRWVNRREEYNANFDQDGALYSLICRR